MSWLSLEDGTRVPLKNGFVIGRVAGCDLVIDDSKASRRHARVVIESDVVEIEDLESSNGTLLNDKPVTRRLLRDGDRVQIGKTVIVFHDGELPHAPAKAPPPAPARPAPSPPPPAPAAAAAAPPPAAPPKSAPPPPPPAATFDDDDELFGGPPAPPPPPARTEPARTEPARIEPPRVEAPRPEPLPPPPPPPPPARPAVVEFADEVVEVRRAPQPAAKSAAAPADPTAVTTTGSRILQYSKQGPGKGGLLGDDVSQLSGGMRALILFGAVAFAGGTVWLVVYLMQ